MWLKADFKATSTGGVTLFKLGLGEVAQTAVYSVTLRGVALNRVILEVILSKSRDIEFEDANASSFPFLLQMPFLFPTSVSQLLSLRIVFSSCPMSQHSSSSHGEVKKITKNLNLLGWFMKQTDPLNPLSPCAGPSSEEQCELLSGPGRPPEGGSEVHALPEGEPPALAGMYPVLTPPPCDMDTTLCVVQPQTLRFRCRL